VVRATGGLDDTVEAWPSPRATGFKFSDYNGYALLEAIRDALRLWEDRRDWRGMMVRGMLKDFSWNASAAVYSGLYGEMHPAAA
jgi:starch synthase